LPFLNHFHIKHIIFHLGAMVFLIWAEMSFEKFNGRKVNTSTAKLITQLGHRKKNWESKDHRNKEDYQNIRPFTQPNMANKLKIRDTAGVTVFTHSTVITECLSNTDRKSHYIHRPHINPRDTVAIILFDKYRLSHPVGSITVLT